MSDEILVSQSAGLCEITLNRPDRLNALTDTLHVALQEALLQARDDNQCRALLITGAGRAFCTGQDLNARNPAKLSVPMDLGL